MGIIKPNFYTKEEQELFMTARAFAHPARIKIMKMLRTGEAIRNVDLSPKLNLSKTAIKGHVIMLKEANLIRVEYFIHYYVITLNEDLALKVGHLLKLEKWEEES